MVAAAEAADRVLMEAFHWRYHPMAKRITEIVSTELGTIRRIEASFSVGSIPVDDIRYDLAIGGGALMDLGVYPIQWARHVAAAEGFGEPTVSSARATVGPPEIDITIDAELAWPNGMTARVHCSMEPGAPTGATLTVIGAYGRMTVFNPIAPQHGNLLRVSVAGNDREESVDLIPTYTYQLQAFVDAVERGVKPPTGGRDSIATMKIVDSIYHSAGLHPRPTHPR
jgi:predicted dehydrogenase